jgi:hypothetical protein
LLPSNRSQDDSGNRQYEFEDDRRLLKERVLSWGCAILGATSLGVGQSLLLLRDFRWRNVGLLVFGVVLLAFGVNRLLS